MPAIVCMFVLGGSFCKKTHSCSYGGLLSTYTLSHLSNWYSVENYSRLKVQFSSVTQSCPALCDHMDCGTPGLSVHHQLPEFTQTHVHLVVDAIQQSHPLSSPSPPTFNLSRHQGLFQMSQHHVAEVLEFQLQHQSFQ